MIPRFHVTGSAEPRPESSRTVFADGSADESFREGVDLELSHWVPNRTPGRYAADTSTEICLRFVADPPEDLPDLCVNNHVDVDGVLSLYVLTRGEGALPHADTLVRAAECGDFSNWAQGRALRLFQAITLEMGVAGRDKGETFRVAFALVDRFLDGDEPGAPELPAAEAALEAGVEQIESGRVLVLNLGERFTHFLYPPLDGEELVRALRVPAFNERLSSACWLWPQVRNRFDAERVQLVAVPTHGGVHYDLWYPGYMWADTPNRWRAPGFHHTESTNAYLYGFEPLEEAARRLQEKEPPGEACWIVAEELTPFSSLKGRGFPVVLSCTDPEGVPTPSGLDPEVVLGVLAPVFDAEAPP